MTQKTINIRNLSNLNNRPIRAKWCDTFFSRLRGYTFHKELTLEEGLVLVENRESRMDMSIHMMFVWIDLAVIWVNAKGEVVDTVLAQSWRPFYAPAKPAQYTIEIHPSRLSEFAIGDSVEFLHD
jgi:uncharacterized membrane protein (UPF0127 family)